MGGDPIESPFALTEAVTPPSLSSSMSPEAYTRLGVRSERGGLPGLRGRWMLRGSGLQSLANCGGGGKGLTFARPREPGPAPHRLHFTDHAPHAAALHARFLLTPHGTQVQRLEAPKGGLLLANPPLGGLRVLAARSYLAVLFLSMHARRVSALSSASAGRFNSWQAMVSGRAGERPRRLAWLAARLVP